jgi:hypothetical protein
VWFERAQRSQRVPHSTYSPYSTHSPIFMVDYEKEDVENFFHKVPNPHKATYEKNPYKN